MHSTEEGRLKPLVTRSATMGGSSSRRVGMLSTRAPSTYVIEFGLSLGMSLREPANCDSSKYDGGGLAMVPTAQNVTFSVHSAFVSACTDGLMCVMDTVASRKSCCFGLKQT
mmetsp:Transcript_11501/g.16661  ORF Transcript_11501/g.16661 Transcript_11501/m.16661 type:complete len:112 (+) Transcript_11501:935-1270(+)